MMRLYATLGVVLNGTLLLEQAGVVIDDHVGRPCRVTVESAIPEEGFEVEARGRIGERVKLAVHIMRYGDREPGPKILEVEGPIVATRTDQPPAEGRSTALPRTFFTVEDQPEKTEDETA